MIGIPTPTGSPPWGRIDTVVVLVRGAVAARVPRGAGAGPPPGCSPAQETSARARTPRSGAVRRSGNEEGVIEGPRGSWCGPTIPHPGAAMPPALSLPSAVDDPLKQLELWMSEAVRAGAGE